MSAARDSGFPIRDEAGAVFLIQNTQNRDTKCSQLKLDELIRAKDGARNSLLRLDDLSEDELKGFEKEFQRFRKLKHASPPPKAASSPKI